MELTDVMNQKFTIVCHDEEEREVLYDAVCGVPWPTFDAEESSNPFDELFNQLENNKEQFIFEVSRWVLMALLGGLFAACREFSQESQIAYNRIGDRWVFVLNNEEPS